jgi:hypothetical protein
VDSGCAGNAIEPNAPGETPREHGRQRQSHQHRIPGQPELIMTIGVLPDAMEPGIHCVRTHWIRGFIAFQLTRRTRSVMLMVPV